MFCVIISLHLLTQFRILQKIVYRHWYRILDSDLIIEMELRTVSFAANYVYCMWFERKKGIF